MVKFFRNSDVQAHGCNRRALLAGTAATVLAASAREVTAQQAEGASRLNGATQAAPSPAPKKPALTELPGNRNRYPDLLALTKACAGKGEACVKQCVSALNQGDTTLVDCLKAATAMIPICRALERYASIEARYMADLLKLAVAVNEDCEGECRKHAAHHAALKECADACKACAVECHKVLERLA